MSQQRFDLNVEPRAPGKGVSRSLRTNRRVPAVIYGSVQSRPITLEEGAVRKYNVRAFENALFTLKSDDKDLNNVVVLMKSVQVHPLSRNPEHVDLFALDLKKAVRVSIEIRVEGKAAGLADGGLLNVVNRQIEIECLPTEIPDGVTVDVSAMGVGDSLHVSDIQLPEGVKLISSPDLTIAVVNLQEEEVAAPAADAAAAAPAAGAAAAAPAKGAAAAPAKDAKK